MSLRVCAEPGCPELCTTTRCTTHTRTKDRARGTRQERGYDARYDRHRKREARRVAKGNVECWSCGALIDPNAPWDDGHCGLDRSVIHGAQCAGCNRDTSRPGCAHISHVT